eukprot:PhF_6_TR10372/c0_g1_i2/m.16135
MLLKPRDCFLFIGSIMLLSYLLSFKFPIPKFSSLLLFNRIDAKNSRSKESETSEIEQADEENQTRIREPVITPPPNKVKYSYYTLDGNRDVFLSTTIHNVRVLREVNSTNEAFVWSQSNDMYFPFFKNSLGVDTPGVRVLSRNARNLPDVSTVPVEHIPRAIVVYMLACVNNYHHAWSDTFI